MQTSYVWQARVTRVESMKEDFVQRSHFKYHVLIEIRQNERL